MNDAPIPSEPTVLVERIGHVAVLRLHRGVTNAISPGAVEELTRAVDEAREDDDVRGLVLTSEGEKFLSIGWDIPLLYEFDRPAFQAVMERF